MVEQQAPGGPYWYAARQGEAAKTRLWACGSGSEGRHAALAEVERLEEGEAPAAPDVVAQQP